MTEHTVRYNVRTAEYDPRKSVAVEPFEVDLARETPLMLKSIATVRRKGGPASRRLAELMLEHVPVKEHEHLAFTVRPQVFGLGHFPTQTPTMWHTDYAHNLEDVSRRLGIHTYTLITSGPRTLFLQDGDLDLPHHRKTADFSRAIRERPKFSAEPWTIVRFNATEVHTAVSWDTQTRQPRLFFRATYDPLVRQARY